MRRKSLEVAQELSTRLAGVNSIETITLGEAAEIETFDPYFSVDMDVYFHGKVIPVDKRLELFDHTAGFQSHERDHCDTFLVGELPVQIYYKEISRIEQNLQRLEEGRWVYREGGTHMLYRLQNSQVLFSRSTWLEQAQNRLTSIPESFWSHILEASKSAVNRYLSDISASVFRNDDLFFTISCSGFIRSLSAFLFAVNRQFEPSGRMFHEHIRELGDLPSEFEGRFESFLKYSEDFPPERKREIAELLAKSIIA